MARLLRLVLVCLLACALPLQGAVGMTLRGLPGAPTPQAAGSMAADAPCPFHAHHQHAPGHVACGDCCGPAAAATPVLAAAPVVFATLSAAPRPALRAAAPIFLTGGPDRPPRALLA